MHAIRYHPSLTPPKLVPPHESSTLPLCHGGSVSRSPTYCRVLILPTKTEGRSGAPPPEPRGGSRPPPRAEAEPAPGPPRTHPTLPPASPPPPDTAGAHLVYKGPTAAAGGGGARATPRRGGPPPAVSSYSPTRRAGYAAKNQAQDSPVLAHPRERRGGHASPPLSPFFFALPTCAQGPHSPGG